MADNRNDFILKGESRRDKTSEDLIYELDLSGEATEVHPPLELHQVVDTATIEGHFGRQVARNGNNEIDFTSEQTLRALHANGLMVKIGEGGEGQALLFADLSPEGKYTPWVLKVFHDPERAAGPAALAETDKHPINRFGKVLRGAAGNLRLADNIANIRGVCDLLETRTRQLFDAGYYKVKYHDLADRAGTLEDIAHPESLETYVNFLEKWFNDNENIPDRIFEDEILPRLDELLEELEADLEEDPPTGLVSYLHRVLDITHEIFDKPEFHDPKQKKWYLGIPERIFPEVPAAGLFPETYPNRRLAGALYIVMGYAPRSLESTMETLAKQMKRELREPGSDNEYVVQLLQKVMRAKYFPHARFDEYEFMLKMLHSFGLVYCDPNPGCLAIDHKGRSIILDPSCIALKGTLQTIATRKYLTPKESDKFTKAQLITDPRRDLEVFDEIVLDLEEGFEKQLKTDIRLTRATELEDGNLSAITIYGNPNE